MEYSSGGMSYSPPGERIEGLPSHQPSSFNHHKFRGMKNNTYHTKKSYRNASNGGLSEMICMNCGSLEHWANHCPEPSRDSYAGSMHPPPPKRQKMHRSAGHYRGDSQFHRHPQDPYDYPYPPRHDYDRMPMDPYGAPMPHHHYSPSYGRWQQGPPPRDYYGYPSYGHEDGPPIPDYGGAHYPGPPVYDREYYPPDYPPYSGEADYERYPPDHYDYPPRDPYHPHASSSLKRRSGPWADERKPHDPRDAKADNQIVWRPPVQVARPLPSDWEDLDDMNKLPAAGSLPRGMTVSKYILDRPAEDFLCNIRETEDWPFMMSDPIFLSVSTDSEMVTIEELISRRNKIYETHRVQVKVKVDYDENEREIEMGPNECSDAERPTYDGSQNGDASQLSAKPEPRSPCLISHGGSSPGGSRPGSSASSPVKSERLEADPRLPRAKELRSSKEGSNGHDDNGLQVDKAKPRQNDRNGLSNNNKRSFDHNSHRVGSVPMASQRYSKPQAANGQGPSYKPRNGSCVPKDLPPKPSFNENEQASIKRENPDERGIQCAKIPEHKPRRFQGQSDRDRRSHFKRGDSPASVDDEPRRQEDDVTPRFKRRQPRVAEAYSRRW